FGNGETANNVKQANVVYDNVGTYTVTLTATYNNCTHTISKQIVVEDNPTIDFTIDNKTVSCNKASALTPTFPDNNYSYTWYILKDTIRIDTLYTRTINYNFYQQTSSSASFSVVLEVKNSLGCVASLLKENFVNVVVTSVDIIHINEPTCYWLPIRPSVVINSAHAFDSIIWNFGDGTPNVVGQVAPFHTYSQEGTYNLSVRVVYNNCEIITKQAQISVGYKVSNFVGNIINTTVCVHDTVFLKAANLSNVPIDFKWLMGDGFFEVGNNTFHRYNFPSQPTTYTVKLVGSYLGCPDTMKIDDVMVLYPKANFFTQTVCNKDRTIKVVNSATGADSVVYDMGNGDKLINPSLVFEYTYASNNLDNYKIKQIVYNKTTNCTDSLIRSIVLESINVDLIATKNIGCAPFKTQLKSNLLNAFFIQLQNFYWVIGSDTCKRCYDYEYQVQPNKIYDVKLVLVYNDSCKKEIVKDSFLIGDAVSATVKPNVLSNCQPYPVLFNDSVTSFYSSLDTILYDFGDGFFADT
ncbi:MAG: hypothetical protein KC414_14565, partial [Romboutsia sp.]|nr:hypothetical protein [Romboutsia sp.]